MGQAAQRKAQDPNYGKISNSMRGLLISCPIRATPSGGINVNSQLDAQDLRSSLLYWDRLVWPLNRRFQTIGNENDKYLESRGIILRPKYDIAGNETEIFANLQATALADLEKKEPGVWSLGQGENSFLISGGVADPAQGTLIQLYNAIPLPKSDVPLDEILSFRQKRRPELLAFRSYLEDMTREIHSSNDTQGELDKKLSELDLACSNLISVAREWQFPVYLGTVDASLNLDLPKAASAATKAWLDAEKLSLGLTEQCIAAFSAATLSQIKVKSDIKFRSIKRTDTPFKYAYHVQRDLT